MRWPQEGRLLVPESRQPLPVEEKVAMRDWNREDTTGTGSHEFIRDLAPRIAIKANPTGTCPEHPDQATSQTPRAKASKELSQPRDLRDGAAGQNAGGGHQPGGAGQEAGVVEGEGHPVAGSARTAGGGDQTSSFEGR